MNELSGLTPVMIFEKIVAASDGLQEVQRELYESIREEADTERKYRFQKAHSYAQTSGTVAEREAAVDLAVDLVRYEAHLAEAMSKAKLEDVRNRRAILSAYQTLLNGLKAEAELAKTSPLDG